MKSPFGGQGINLGLGDAMNLGWKLASVIKEWTPEELLDTYTAERHPIGAWALEWTRAQIALMRPEPHARAMGEITRALIEIRAGATYFAKGIAGVWQLRLQRERSSICPASSSKSPIRRRTVWIFKEETSFMTSFPTATRTF
jgi:hypothetical protein